MGEIMARLAELLATTGSEGSEGSAGKGSQKGSKASKGWKGSKGKAGSSDSAASSRTIKANEPKWKQNVKQSRWTKKAGTASNAIEVKWRPPSPKEEEKKDDIPAMSAGPPEPTIAPA